MKIIAIAKAKAKEGMEETAQRKLMELVDYTRSENGCLTYKLHQALTNGGEFMTYEVWENRQAFDSHLEQSYVRELLARTEELFTGSVEITLWGELELT